MARTAVKSCHGFPPAYESPGYLPKRTPGKPALVSAWLIWYSEQKVKANILMVLATLSSVKG